MKINSTTKIFIFYEAGDNAETCYANIHSVTCFNVGGG